MSVNDAIAALPAYKSLTSFIKAENKKALEDTVSEFKDLAKKSESQIEDFLWDTYNAIFAVAKQTSPENQTPLVDLLQRLRGSTVTASDGQPLKLNSQVVWKDLPTFGWVARDLWNFGEYTHLMQQANMPSKYRCLVPENSPQLTHPDAFDTSASAEEKASWINLSAFAAQLTARADLTNPQDPFDFSLYGLWALRSAFEEEQAADAAEGQTIATRLAYQWTVHAKDALYKLSTKSRDFEGKSGKPGSKFADREWKGLNEERWQSWIDGFAAVSQSTSDKEVSALAKEAAEKMKSK
ncbi:hypothetical protein CSAL01_06131 [Colletotrichum salicis]|uniref:Uncharacterized protein n=1 Tax=Colletotrichum salicis TaxID=1209931 RepID=A0A135U948_9PEZI|nr:hypothetical protein CSAL01_06131 [Colletotrichum salicis]